MSRFQFVKDHKDAYGVKRLCEIVDVARSSFYAWLEAGPGRAARAAADAELAERIRVVQDPARGGDRAYGAPRVTAELNDGVPASQRVNHKRVARVMREHCLAGIRLRRRVKTTVPDQSGRRFPDLIGRDFTAEQPNQRYVGDITYLPIADGSNLAHRTGITEWWIGKANREDLTWPVWELRATARALGLVSVRKGRIAPTRAIAARRGDPQAILRHITGRLPLGTTPAERHAGWMALVVAANETPAELWESRISELLFELGWRDREDPYRAPSPDSPTLDALNLLTGAMRVNRRPKSLNTAVAAIARTVIRA